MKPRVLTLILALAGSLALSLPAQEPDFTPEPPPSETPPSEPPDTTPDSPPDTDPGDAPETWAIFQNISTRALLDNESYVVNGQNFGIINASVIVAGSDTATQTVVWRGRGPSLNLVDGVLNATDPLVEVVQPGIGILKSNENYLDDDQYSLIEGTFLVPNGIQNNEAIATTLDLAPGPFSARVKSDSDTRGVGQVEAFAYFENAASEPSSEPSIELSNISTRGPVGAGTQESMNTNFIIVGPGFTSIVCRGRGPSINLPDGVTKLPDPFIELVQIGTGVIASNDSYEQTNDLDLITGTSFIPDGIQANEAIIVAINLEPGAYTVRLRNSDSDPNGEGIGIAEAFVADF